MLPQLCCKFVLFNNSVCHAYSPCMEEYAGDQNIVNCFIQHELMYFLVMDKQGLKHTGV